MPNTVDVTYVFQADARQGVSAQTLNLTRSVPSTTPQALGLEAVGFTILAASIQPDLNTDSFTLTLSNGGSTMETISLAKSLPGLDELVDLFNAGILEAFPVWPEPLPVMVEKGGGFVVRNSSTLEDATFEFSANAVVLWFSDPAIAPGGTLFVPAGTDSAIFLPSPRLGAQFQTLEVSSGGSGGIKLPLAGPFMSGAIYYPTSGTATGIATLAQTAEVTTIYPAVDATLKEKPLTRTAFVLGLNL